MNLTSFGNAGQALRSRPRHLPTAIVACCLVALAGPACVPEPGVPATTTSTTSTTAPPWLPAGCYPNTFLQALLGSLQFSGTENQLGNTLQHFSTDGSCVSLTPAAVTIVRSPDAASALTFCIGLGGPDTFTSVSNVAANGWEVPTDAWFCQTPIFG